LNHCFHLLGGELAGIEKGKEKKRKEETRSRETTLQKREERDHEPSGSHQCLEWGIF